MARHNPARHNPEQDTPRPAYLRLASAAGLLDVSVDTIRRRIADGTIDGYRVGGQLRIREADLHKLAVRVPVGASQ